MTQKTDEKLHNNEGVRGMLPSGSLPFWEGVTLLIVNRRKKISRKYF